MSPDTPKKRSNPRANPREKTTASFVVVANRLPVDRVENPDGSVDWRTSPGGLVTAFEPVMRMRQGAWVGWHGAAGRRAGTVPAQRSRARTGPVSALEIEEYYEGFSNATLWPLYHDVIATPVYHREWWDSYVAVNRRFAEAAAEVADQGGVVWVQDYQLQLVPQMLRNLRADLRIGFFLHIPFPPTELFQQLPWRNQILEGLLGADLVGFQLPGGAQNFVRLVRQRLNLRDPAGPDPHPGRPQRAGPRVPDLDRRAAAARTGHDRRRPRRAASRSGMTSAIRRSLFLGVDRLDYTKGMPERIRAYGELVAEGSIDPERRGLRPGRDPVPGAGRPVPHAA